MAYTGYLKNSISSEAGKKTLASGRNLVNKPNDATLFFELEPAVVVDVIRDENHPVFKNKSSSPKVEFDEFPEGFNSPNNIDYSWIGRVRVRLLKTHNKKGIDELIWALPHETTIKEFPLVNEIVIVSEYLSSFFYTRRLNYKNFISFNAEYRLELNTSNDGSITSKKSSNLVGARNRSNISPINNNIDSYLGKYYKANNMIRPLRHYEGDTVIESRFGNSIRFGNYIDSPSYDIGTASGDGENYAGNLGNPMILIRNRQRPLQNDELKYGHSILEDVNRDGSSIQITSGKTLSKFKHTLGRPIDKPQRMTNPGLSFALGNLSNSEVGTKKIKSQSSGSTKKAQELKDIANDPDFVTTNESNEVQQKMAGHASKGDHGSALKEGFKHSVGEEDGEVIGDRLGKMDTETASKFIETPNSNNGKTIVANSGVNVQTTVASTDGSGGGSGIGGGLAMAGAGVAISGGLTQTGGSSIGSQASIKRANFLGDVGSGNFKLNSTFESGIVGSIASSNKFAQGVLAKTPAGPALSAANSLGIDIDGLSDIGINSGDSLMFKIFKLASMGILAICGLLKKKQGSHGSKTEEALGWVLSFGINIALLAILMGLFNKLRNMKFALGVLVGFSLKDFLFDICDFVNQIEWGNSLTETVENELQKMFTQQLGDQLTSSGTYGPFAMNHPDFDQQFSAIGKDVNALGGALGAGGGVSGFVSLQNNNQEVATMSFDPTSGLFRDKGGSSQSSGGVNFQQSAGAGGGIFAGSGINYQTQPGSGVTYGGGSSAMFGGTISGSGTKVNEVSLNKNINGDSSTKTFQAGSSFNPPFGSTLTSNGKSEYTQNNSNVNLAAGSTVTGHTSTNIDGSMKVNAGSTINATAGSTITDSSGNKKTINQNTDIKLSENTDVNVPQEKQESDGIQYETPEDGGIKYESDIDEPVSNDDKKRNEETKPSGDKTNDALTDKTKNRKTTTTKPKNVKPAPEDPDEVTNFHNGETITRNSLKGTPIEKADMNAVSLLHPEDLETLKDTNKVKTSVSTAKEAKQKKLNEALAKVEKQVIKEAQEKKVIFGKQLPALTGNQIVINSERIIISSKTQETGIYAKKKFFVATDDEITLNCIDRFVAETKTHTSVISPTIHLGAYITRRHPVLKGNNTTAWLSSLCGWLSSHVHHDPYITTSRPAQQGSLSALRSRLPTLLSTRVFIDG
jgi:hypothetical protein